MDYQNHAWSVIHGRVKSHWSDEDSQGNWEYLLDRFFKVRYVMLICHDVILLYYIDYARWLHVRIYSARVCQIICQITWVWVKSGTGPAITHDPHTRSMLGSWAMLGPCWAYFGLLGWLYGAPWDFEGCVGPKLVHLGSVWAYVEAMLSYVEPFRVHSWPILANFVARKNPSTTTFHVEGSWGQSLGHVGPMFWGNVELQAVLGGSLWAMLCPYWDHVGAFRWYNIGNLSSSKSSISTIDWFCRNLASHSAPLERGQLRSLRARSISPEQRRY